MTVIVTDNGFAVDTWGEGVLDLASDASSEELLSASQGGRRIRIHFSGYADGRGFTLARRLRLMGYDGALRAAGPLVAEQYAMARRSGFDEVEISDETAARQPWGHWQSRSNWQANDYQARLRGTA